ncbi:MAG: AraC family transcriptional regulator [Hyphomicrobiaceae bacterium]
MILRLATREPILRTHIIEVIREYFSQLSVDSNRTFRRAGFDYDLLQVQPGGISLNAVVELFEIASEELDDEYFGLHLAEWTPVGHLGLLDHVVLTAPTLRVALSCLAEYAEVAITAVQLEFAETGHSAILTGRLPGRMSAPSHQFVDFFLASLIVRIRRCLGRRWRPEQTVVARHQPKDLAPYHRVFGRRISFDSSDFQIQLPRKELAHPMPLVLPGLHETVLQAAEQILSELRAEQDIVSQVAAIVADRLSEHNDVGLQVVAAQLQMSPRALQWRLSRYHATFEGVLTDVRLSLATAMLRDTSEPIGVIGHRLGFSEGSAFSRWSKQHFGKGPRLYRRQLRGQS